MEQKPVVSANVGPSVQYCCILLEELKKHLCVLYQEVHLIRNIEEELSNKKNTYNDCSSSINNKLLYLWAFCDQHPQDNSKSTLRNFLIQLTKNWKESEDKLALGCVSVPILSRTSPRVSLPAILEKSQYIAESTKFTFQTITAHFVCSRHAAYLYNEIMCAIARLSTYVVGAHYSLLLSRLLPYLQKINSTLETIAKAGSCEGVQLPPGPSTAQGDAGDEDKGPTEANSQGDTSCLSFPMPPINRDPMYTVDGKVAPGIHMPPQLCSGLGLPVRFQRVLRPLAPFGSPRPANVTAVPSINIKAEPLDQETTKHRATVEGPEDDCDLLPIKIPRLETGLLAPLT